MNIHDLNEKWESFVRKAQERENLDLHEEHSCSGFFFVKFLIKSLECFQAEKLERKWIENAVEIFAGRLGRLVPGNALESLGFPKGAVLLFMYLPEIYM